MNHLIDETLNEYLDEALTPAARRDAETHLRDCADCEARLAELSLVFSALASLPDVELARDLSASVVRMVTPRLTPRPVLPRPIQWVVGLQFAAALTTLIASLPILQTMFVFNVPTFSLPTLPDLLMRFDQITLAVQLFFTHMRLPAFDPRLTSNLSSLFISVTVFSVTLLWVVGNGLLLRHPNQSHR